jgi:hypothetical protein
LKVEFERIRKIVEIRFCPCLGVTEEKGKTLVRKSHDPGKI